MSSVAPLDNDNYQTTISTMSSEAPLDKDNYATTISTLQVILILWGLLGNSKFIADEIEESSVKHKSFDKTDVMKVSLLNFTDP